MQIDLENKVTRFVVQEYVNAIVNFKSQAELDFDTHKLIHTFKVVQVAQQLIDLTRPKLSPKLQKQILNAAVLHDIGRCYEFQNGIQKKNFNHGIEGAELIHKKFPKMAIEGLSTYWHNRAPSDDDPAVAQPVLDYTRDADILGNLIYNIQRMPIFLKHILQMFPENETGLKINNEIINAAQEGRSCCYNRMEKWDFLDMMLAQLGWIYNLRTRSGFLLAQKERIFSRYRDTVISDVLLAVSGTEKQRKQAAKQIMELFPDKVFLKEFQKHDL
ncbi:MAG: hypothetical protein SPL08_00995 [Pseudomonadota bacterium]|nr:hypothetical protein [Pseudomonadota bacterium]